MTDASFDSRKAPVARGFFLGDYKGLGSNGGAVFPFFAMAQGSDPSSIFVRQVTPTGPQAVRLIVVVVPGNLAGTTTCRHDLQGVLPRRRLQPTSGVSRGFCDGQRVASASKELRATMELALEDATIGADPLDELRARREPKRARR